MLEVEWLGLVAYGEALALQEDAVRARLSGEAGDRLLLLEHSPVVTLGRSTDRANLKRSEAELRAAGIDLFEVSRGGDVTYHAPGQLVGYPILDLEALDRRDAHAHLRRLETALIEALESLGVPAQRVEGRTGVFIDRSRSARPDGPDRKIASIGVGLRRWVTFHGFALNVSIDLTGFDAIVPCGLADVEMTSVARELAEAGGFDARSATDRRDLDERVRAVVTEQMQRQLEPDSATADRP